MALEAGGQFGHRRELKIDDLLAPSWRAQAGRLQRVIYRQAQGHKGAR